MKKLVITISLPCEVRAEGKWHIASCPPLDIVTQGADFEQAKANLVEALHLFLRSCLERGVLEQVLRDCGFNPGDDTVDAGIPENMVNISLPIYAPENATCRA